MQGIITSGIAQFINYLHLVCINTPAMRIGAVGACSSLVHMPLCLSVCYENAGITFRCIAGPTHSNVSPDIVLQESGSVPWGEADDRDKWFVRIARGNLNATYGRICRPTLISEKALVAQKFARFLGGKAG